MTISDKLSLLEQTKETQRVKLGLPERTPFSRYHEFFEFKFVPSYLFVNGEQGVWFDPSDLSTMFQDVDGTEPVTKDGDPVALIKDKSGNGNHATQTTASARPIYRSGDGRGAVNLVKNSETFLQSRAHSSKVVRAADVLSPIGTDNVTYFTANINAERPRYTVGIANLGTYSVYAKAGTWDKLFVGSTNGAGYWSLICFDLSQGTILDTHTISTGAKVGNPIITPVGDGWYRCSVESIVASQFILMPAEDGSRAPWLTMTNKEEGGVYLWGMQSEYSTTVTPYQANGNYLGGIATGKDTDRYWLEFDGVDDNLSTATLPFYTKFFSSIGFNTNTESANAGTDNNIFGQTGHAYARAGITARNNTSAGFILGNTRVRDTIVGNSTGENFAVNKNMRLPKAVTVSSVSGTIYIKVNGKESLGDKEIPKPEDGTTRSIYIGNTMPSTLGSFAFYGGVHVLNANDDRKKAEIHSYMQSKSGAVV